MLCEKCGESISDNDGACDAVFVFVEHLVCAHQRRRYGALLTYIEAV